MRFSIVVSLLLCAFPLAAQTDTANMNAVGFPETGSFTGSDIESVAVGNGNLHVHIPLYSTPGRGVGRAGAMVYDSKDFVLTQNCTNQCSYIISPVLGNNVITVTQAGIQRAEYLDNQILHFASIVPVHVPGTTNPRDSCDSIPGHPPYYQTQTGMAARSWDGTEHGMVPSTIYTGFNSQPCWSTSSKMLYAVDGSGWAGVVGGYVSKSGGVPMVSDTNGNHNVEGSTDTLGRSISDPFSYYDSNGVKRTITITTESLAIKTSLCGTWSSSGSCGEYIDTWPVPHVITLPDGLKYTIEYYQNQEGEISSITLPTGAVISYTYSPTPSAAGNGRPVATRTVTVNGVSSTWTYTYTAASGSTPATTRVTAPPVAPDTTGTSVLYTLQPENFMNNYVDIPSTSPSDTFGTTKEQTYDASGNLLKTVDYVLGLAGLPTRVTTSWPNGQVSKIETDYETMLISLYPDGQFGPQNAPITWGNVTAKREYDYGSGSPGALIRETDYSYLHTDTTVNPSANQAQYLALNIADRPTSEIIKDGSGNIVAQTKYHYDEGTLLSTSASPAVNHDYTNFSYSNTIRGNLTRLSRWDNTSNTWLDTTYTYDDLGNQRSVTDPKGNTTTSDYGESFSGASCNTTSMPTYAFKTTVTSATPFSFQTKSKYYQCSSLLASASDQNDLNAQRTGTSYTYDLLNRLQSTTRADGGSTSISYGGTAANNYQDTLPLTEMKTAAIDAATNMTSSTVTDGFGRPIQTQTATPAGTVYVDTKYDAVGRVASVSNPYSGNPPADGLTSYIYDALDRKVIQCQPDNGNNSPCVPSSDYLQWSYSGATTTSSDELRNTWQRTTDALGRLIQVVEPGALNTTYTYDPLANLQCVDQWGTGTIGTPCRSSKRRSFAYDSLSRLTSSYNPESGKITYLYLVGAQKCSGDPTSPCSKTDARSITTTYTYDNLNRLTFIRYSYGTPLAAIGYDGKDENNNPLSGLGITTSNAIGRLSIAWNEANAGEAFGYDTEGRINRETYRSPSANNWTNVVSANYDYAGNARTIVYPDSRTVSQSVDSANRLTSVNYTSWGATSKTQPAYLTVTANGYDPAGHLISGTFGNGVAVSASYDDRERAHSLSYGPSSSPLWAKQYTWNLANNLILANDSVQGIARQYTYDNLNRITRVYRHISRGVTKRMRGRRWPGMRLVFCSSAWRVYGSV